MRTKSTIKAGKMNGAKTTNLTALQYFNKKKYLYLMLLPCVIYFILFHYVPMYGIVMAFKDFDFGKGIWNSPWIGLENFRYMFSLPDFYSVLKNSLTLSLLRLLFGFPMPLLLALMINEIRMVKFKKTVQTIIYLPHFISWVVIGGILVNFLSPTWGVVNKILGSFGVEPIFFMAEEKYFKWMVVLSSIWKEAGWGTILYLAALTAINPELYEAARIDGANRFQQLYRITLPCIVPTIVTLFILRTGTIMSNGSEQILVLQNSQNLSVSEVFETYTYRVGIIGGRYSFATTVGLFTSVIGTVLIVCTNRISKMMGENGLW
ncbi:ABC transporter permease [Ructibacterium gallinarum]|uniref:Sugar ABC transporter permease n=1 Tax=Ructibacterium gallinarum TaxID=2779355 RepID=A0A9D5RCM9_9FIRM|nr:ABC transporter permease subunit [Ructibacterium gallinarum]MBE5041143.1 sugar ABC transporter permease [Ructibacterium gallinarum]